MRERAWITGASSGIGRALALELARRGVTVAVSARRRDELDKLAAEAPPGRVRAFPVDVADADAMARTAEKIERNLGPLDLAVFNAGTHAPVEIEHFSVAPFRHLVESNYMGAVHGLAAIIPRMIARRAGEIAVVSSVAGYRGLPSASAYGPTKAALINLCESLRLDLARHGVRMSLINPGFIRTPLTDRNDFPMPFLMEADAAAKRIVAGLDRGQFEITFPRRFTWILKVIRVLPYALYFPLIARQTKRDGRAGGE